MRDVVTENRNLTTRVSTQSEARELELIELRQHLATQQVANITLTNQLTAVQTANDALRNAAVTTHPVATGGEDSRALRDEIRQLTVNRDSYKRRVIELSSKVGASQDRVQHRANRETVVRLTAELAEIQAQLEAANDRIVVLTADLETAELVAGLSSSSAK